MQIFVKYAYCSTIMVADLKHFEIPANTEGSVRAKFKHCTQVIAGSTKVTSNFVKQLKVRISSWFTCHIYRNFGCIPKEGEFNTRQAFCFLSNTSIYKK